jgi:lipoyl-dependent peroxiredoxin
MEKIKISYTATAINTGGRRGHVKTDDGMLDFEVAMPKEIGGPGGKTNPEQLFAAGYATCFGGTLAAIAKDTSLKDSKITVKVHTGVSDEGGYALAVDIAVSIPKASSLEEAQELVEAAHAECIYSKAVKGNIEVRIKAV